MKSNSKGKAVKGILKWPLVIAAILVVGRVVIERAGGPEGISGLFSTVVLQVLIVPLYLAIRIAKSGLNHPYKELFKLIAIYAVLVRAMVLPTYWLARIYGWTNLRFAGLSESESSALIGYIGIPVGTGLSWIVGSIVIGGLLGSIVIAVLRRKGAPAAA
jgi:hypothetical protein